LPAAGLLDVDTFGTSIDGANVDLILALVDFKGNVATALNGSDPAAAGKLYDSLAAAFSLSGTSLEMPKRVSAGKHTIRWYAISYSSVAGDTSKIVLRQLTALYVPGIAGTAPKWQIPAPRQTLRQILPRG
jgi:hypothetical protein